MKQFAIALICALTLSTVTFADGTPSWIWLNDTVDDQKAWFRYEFDSPKRLAVARLTGAADNQFTAFVNGEKVLQNDDWQQVGSVNIEKYLTAGRNVVAVRAANKGGAAGMFCRITITHENGNVSYHGTDGNWSSIGEPEPEPGWSRTGYADSAWTASKVIGPVGA
ncbi:MAG: hypothetical protein VCD00_20960, partial [Candidatus Hydrogenedentota bacterium]